MYDNFEADHGQIQLVLGNIVTQTVDAIVNAANTKLTGGGGVDGAIHRAAGAELTQACLALPADDRGRRCPTGEVRVTTAGRLSSHYIIHAVGPFYTSRYAAKASEQLRQVHNRALTAAAELGCRAIAFPAISTGAYRFPLLEAAAIALTASRDYLRTPSSLEIVRFVLFKPPHLEAFRVALTALR